MAISSITPRPPNHSSLALLKVVALSVFIAIFLAPVSLAGQINPAKDAVPADPNKMWAAQTSPTMIQLVWQHLSGAAAYRVYCAVGVGAPSLKGTVTAPTSVIDLITGMVRRVAYSIPIRVPEAHRCYVQPVDAKGLASTAFALNEVVPGSKDLVAVGAPTSLVASESAGGEVILTWNTVPGATGHMIGRSVYPSGFSTICSLCPDVPRYIDKFVKPGVKHTYAVTAVTAQGPSTRVVSNVITPSSGAKAIAASL
ncbi:MAG TPA: fibronectin type III domain-containing protein, partial [Gemmatimonadaceae bacterium]|nr:fibronectin type III domain-containing protein [Gemmatimonadaceae bacterium]